MSEACPQPVPSTKSRRMRGVPLGVFTNRAMQESVRQCIKKNLDKLLANSNADVASEIMRLVNHKLTKRKSFPQYAELQQQTDKFEKKLRLQKQLRSALQDFKSRFIVNPQESSGDDSNEEGSDPIIAQSTPSSTTTASSPVSAESTVLLATLQLLQALREQQEILTQTVQNNQAQIAALVARVNQHPNFAPSNLTNSPPKAPTELQYPSSPWTLGPASTLPCAEIKLRQSPPQSFFTNSLATPHNQQVYSHPVMVPLPAQQPVAGVSNPFVLPPVSSSAHRYHVPIPPSPSIWDNIPFLDTNTDPSIV